MILSYPGSGVWELPTRTTNPSPPGIQSRAYWRAASCWRAARQRAGSREGGERLNIHLEYFGNKLQQERFVMVMNIRVKDCASPNKLLMRWPSALCCLSRM